GQRRGAAAFADRSRQYPSEMGAASRIAVPARAGGGAGRAVAIALVALAPGGASRYRAGGRGAAADHRVDRQGAAGAAGSAGRAAAGRGPLARIALRL